MTWGSAEEGGDSRKVQEKLRGVITIRSTSSAFAAIRGDGTVVTWGNPSFGGDSSAVQHQLADVVDISATAGAFAAVSARERLVM